ncbi:thymidylate kinase [Abditibacteriota bacterium]|nr:thymidylate kinase [Abditibacteriota bacterium]
MFFSFEGIDGSGKTTQLKQLTARLEETGLSVVATREPGGTRLAEAIRGLLLEKSDSVEARAELLLFGASRAQHVAQIIKPALKASQWVLSDRFADSSEAYQGALGLDREFIRAMNAFATGELQPKRTFFLDVAPEVGFERRRDGTEDRIEARGLEFLTSVRARYLEIARREPERVVVLDGAFPPDQLATMIWEDVEAFLVGG